MTLSPPLPPDDLLAAVGAGRWHLQAGRLQADREAARLLVPGGLQPGTQPSVAAWMALLVPADAQALGALLSGPAQPWACVMRGGAQPVLLRAAPDGDGGWHGLATELPETPDTPEGLRARDEFVASIGHELRTPLNAILGFARMARTGPPSPAHAARIEDAAHVMLRVVNDLLDLAQLEAGRLEIDTQQALDLPALFARVAGVAASLRQERPVRLYATLDPACPARLFCDAGRIEQVMLNLAGNALKFTEKGMVVIGAKLRARAGQRATVRLSVSDTGVGIDFQHLDRIGRPFERAQTAARRSGTGLGLAVVRRLLALHGSQLKVASVAGGGTICWFDLEVPCEDVLAHQSADASVCTRDRRFAETAATLARAQGLRLLPPQAEAGCWILDVAHPEAATWLERGQREGRRLLRATALPPASPDEVPLALLGAALAPDAGPADAAPAPDPALHGLRVLLVEDNPVNQQVLTDLMEPLGVRLTVAGDAHNALAMARLQVHDLVLMDMHLPDGDGLATAAALRQLPEGDATALAFLSAHVDAGLRRRAAELGALAFLLKPVAPEDLRALLRSVPRRPVEPPPPALPSGFSAERVRALFAQVWPAQRQAIERAAGEPQALRQAVHALRGSLAMLGERRATELARRVEQGLLDGQGAAQLPLQELLERAHAAAEAPR